MKKIEVSGADVNLLHDEMNAAGLRPWPVEDLGGGRARFYFRIEPGPDESEDGDNSPERREKRERARAEREAGEERLAAEGRKVAAAHDPAKRKQQKSRRELFAEWDAEKVPLKKDEKLRELLKGLI